LRTITDEPLDSRGVKTVFGIRGDGSVTLTFNTPTLGTPNIGWGSGIQLRLDLADVKSHGVTISLQAETDGREYVMVDNTTNGQEKHEVKKWAIGSEEFSKRPSAFRATRTNDSLVIAVVIGAVEKEFSQRQVPTEDIYPIGVWIGTGGAAADLDVTVKRLRVTGVALPTDTFLPPANVSFWEVFRWVCLGTTTIGMTILVRKAIRG